MKKGFDQFFQLETEGSSVKQEVLAGMIGFFYGRLHYCSKQLHS